MGKSWDSYSAVRKIEVTRRSLWHAQQGNCWICGGRMSRKNTHSALYASRDHLVPASKGGLHLLNNKLLAHNKCNALRGNGELTPEQFCRAREILHAAVAYEISI